MATMKPTDDLTTALAEAYPELAKVREAAGAPVYLVGGAVRDLLLGRGRSDIDLAVIGDAAELAARLGADPVEHERFATAKVELDGHEIDIAGARTEVYEAPGALPDVAPAARIEDDLSRRDFTINAMALPLLGAADSGEAGSGEAGLIDPHDGLADLQAGLLRVLHPGSFEDDPTRALRAARYAARFGFALEAGTEALLRKADLETVSTDRRQAELRRLAAEPEAVRGFALLAEWGLVETRPGGLQLGEKVAALLSSPPWRDFAERAPTLLAAVLGPVGGEEELARLRPGSASAAVAGARGRDPVELALARALGAEWLDRYLLEWRSVSLEIDGADLIEAGVAEGPAVGRGLDEALRQKLDGGLDGREQELEVALRAARESDGVA
jgi:tRNA nucleotidyltransferase (CCA-adding enzyme)